MNNSQTKSGASTTPESASQRDAGASDATAGNATPWSNRDPAWQRVSPKYAWVDLAMNLILIIVVAAAFPPNRYSSELKRLMPHSFKIGDSRIRSLQLPHTFKVSGVTYQCPQKWV